MPVKILFIKALHGDAILLEVANEGSYLNVLIDGGPRRAFRAREPGYVGDAQLRLALDKVRDAKRVIDLLILTHVDDDHIGGVISAFEQPDYLPALAKSVIFNSGQLIHEYFNLPHCSAKNIRGNFSRSTHTSINQGVTLEKLLVGKNIWIRQLFKQGDKHKLGPLEFKFLSPGEENLSLLLDKWNKEQSSPFTGKKSNDYSKSYIDLLKKDEFEEDNSVHNGSSISFIVKINKISILLLADAFAKTVIAGLKGLGATPENPISVDLVKISHHGSERNTSVELLKLIRSKNFVISTNGSQHALPNKRTLARIHDIHPLATIYFNYPELIQKIYTPFEISNLGDRLQPLKGEILLG